MGADRHPDDPEPVRATKALAVWWLGVAAVVTGPLVGGVVPATVALVLARQARRDVRAAQGFLTGSRLVHQGEWLALIGLLLAATTLVVAVVIGLFQVAATPPTRDLAPHFD